MSYGPLTMYPATVLSGASTTSDVYLDRSYKNVLLQVPSMSTGMTIKVQGKYASTDTYYTCYHPVMNSSTVGINSFVISQVVGANGGIVPIPNGLPYMRFVLTDVVSGGCAFKVICSD